jgi:uncharacterized membrane protein YbjE (DUF340 family)
MRKLSVFITLILIGAVTGSAINALFPVPYGLLIAFPISFAIGWYGFGLAQRYQLI